MYQAVKQVFISKILMKYCHYMCRYSLMSVSYIYVFVELKVADIIYLHIQYCGIVSMLLKTADFLAQNLFKSETH